ncbi:MAG: rhodanese-like domain-containing protein [Bacteroidales bacterium]|nr:rhodanese-like domain-containing protein [Bacteroidales bacterium]
MPNAKQLNYYSLNFKQKLLLLPKDEPVYFYCNTGYRSRKAASILLENGYTEIYNLKYGIMEWNLENRIVIISKNAKPDTKDQI